MSCSVLQCAPHYNTLQHAATRCNSLQHTMHIESCDCTLQHVVTHCNTLQHTAARCHTLQNTATHCNPLRHTIHIAPCVVSLHTTTHCHTLQHPATPCSPLQHAASHCNAVPHTIAKCACNSCARVFISETTAYCIWSITQSQSLISFSSVSFRRNVAKEPQRTRS